MLEEKLNLTESYEWVGKFWFPSHDKKPCYEFSGKVTFSPADGARLELIATELDDDDFQKKVMYAYVQGKHGQTRISLLNVSLQTAVISGCKTLKGFASAIIEGDFVETHSFEKIAFQYDDHFENFFLIPQKKERDALRYSKSDAIVLDENTKILCDAYGWSTLISVDDFDAMFVSRNEGDLDKFKEQIRPLLEDKSYSLNKRLETNFHIIFERSKSDIWDFIQMNSQWKLYWELLIDHPIKIKHAYAFIRRTTTNGHEYSDLLPFLYVADTQKEHRIKAEDTRRLPVTFHNFSSNTYDFQILEEPLKKWFKICNSDEWAPVVEGIKRFIRAGTNFADSADYVSLISEIETFLDLTDNETAYVDNLIEMYSYSRWEYSLKKLETNVPEKQKLGKFFRDIRHVIAHPKSCSKKDGGKYKEITSDKILLHNLYSHLAALLMKAILEAVGGLEKEVIENFTDRIVQNRCSYSIINFED